jgi:hypothetical protein
MPDARRWILNDLKSVFSIAGLLILTGIVAHAQTAEEIGLANQVIATAKAKGDDQGVYSQLLGLTTADVEADLATEAGSMGKGVYLKSPTSFSQFLQNLKKIDVENIPPANLLIEMAKALYRVNVQATELNPPPQDMTTFQAIYQKMSTRFNSIVGN